MFFPVTNFTLLSRTLLLSSAVILFPFFSGSLSAQKPFQPSQQCLSPLTKQHLQRLQFESKAHKKYKHSWNFNEIRCRIDRNRTYDSCVRKSHLPPSSNFKIYGKKQASTAALFIHGLTDSSYTMSHLAFSISRNHNVDSYGITLSGHGVDTLGRTSFKALAKASYKHWISDLFYALEKLKYEKGYQKIIIVGHSTGALLALYASLKPCFKSMVSGIALLAPPMNFIKGSPLPFQVSEEVTESISNGLFCKTFSSTKEVSKLKKPKSRIRYRSPNANALCQVFKLKDAVFRLRKQNRRIQVPTLYVGAIASYGTPTSGDNLIDHNIGARLLKTWLSRDIAPNTYLFYSDKASGHAGFLLPRQTKFAKGQPDLTGRNHKKVLRRLRGFFNIVINNICIHQRCLNI